VSTDEFKQPVLLVRKAQSSPKMSRLKRWQRLGLLGGSTPFSPEELFANGEKGFWLDFTDLSTLYQTNDTSTPVTTRGQLIGRVEDKSGNGNHFTQTDNDYRLPYADGSIEGDGNGFLKTPAEINLGSSRALSCVVGFTQERDDISSQIFWEVGVDGGTRGSPSARMIQQLDFPPQLQAGSVGALQLLEESIWIYANSSIDGGASARLPFYVVSGHNLLASGNVNSLYVNGAAVGVDALSENSSISFGTGGVNGYLGIGADGTTAPLTNGVRISHLIIVNRALTTAERTAATEYIGNTINELTAPVATGYPGSLQTLATTDGTWTNAETFTYQWYTSMNADRSGASVIPGATNAEYTIPFEAVGAYWWCEVTGHNGAVSAIAYSNNIGPGEPDPP
jgi:hypothetical protein